MRKIPPVNPALLILASCCLLTSQVAPARAGVILNTLQGYDDGQDGWTGGVDGLYSGSGGNTERILLSAGGRVQWRGERDRWRLQMSGGYEESARQVTARNAVLHLRHNRDIGPAWATIAFGQVQANPFQRLESRWLFGAGLRRDLTEDEHGRLALGVTPMLEIERLDGEAGHVTRGRLSVFLHAARELSATTRLDAAVFWQPLFSDLAVSRTVANITLAVEVNGHVDLKVGAAVEDNARPAAGVERMDWSTFVGLGWDF